jgi:hypothetical protein
VIRAASGTPTNRGNFSTEKSSICSYGEFNICVAARPIDNFRASAALSLTARPIVDHPNWLKFCHKIFPLVEVKMAATAPRPLAHDPN